MTTLTLLTLLALSGPILTQETPIGQGSELPATEGAAATKTNAAELKDRIHEMRKNLLIGGPKVIQAEAEAIAFYSGKAEIVDQRLDTIRAELSEKRATYDLALERALADGDPESQKRAMSDAGDLRAAISVLESEASNLGGKRGDIQKMISATQSRDRERERILTQIETTDGLDLAMDLPMGSVGLAPELPSVTDASPLSDDVLVRDLLARDPRGARRLFFDADPVGYWKRFPLHPDPVVARSMLNFPLPDLPGAR